MTKLFKLTTEHKLHGMSFRLIDRTINYSPKSNLIVFLILFLPFVVVTQTTETFTSTGTWTCPYGVTSVQVECWGGGGSGGGNSTNTTYGGGGGAGGAYAMKTIAVVPGTTYTVTVGATKIGTTGDGAQGNPSWFNTAGTVFAEGGLGGEAPNGATALGGTGTSGASIGDIVYAGGNGADGTTTYSGAGGGGAGSTGIGGNASTTTAGTGTSSNGGNGATGLSAEANGSAGNTYGGGGSGAFVPDATNHNGGNGAAGYVVVTYTGSPSTLTVGASSDNFTSITAARTALESAGVGAAVTIEIQSDYNEGGETYPIVFAEVPGASATNTITYVLASDVVSLVNDGTPASATSLINLNGADYLTFDGRPGGVGTTLADVKWTIRNLRTSTTIGPTIYLQNDATYNTFQFLNVEGESGAGSASTSGIIFLGGGPTTGNDYNTFSFCKVQDLTSGGTAAFPVGGIVVVGTSEAINDGYMTIDNCHVFNIGTPVTASTIYIGGYEMSDWTITNNHMYHSSGTSLPSSAAGGFFVFIFIDDGTGHTITGNYMGGSTSSCGGSALAFTGASNIRGIHLQSLTAGTTTIDNNVFANFSITSTMNVSAGNAYLVAYRLYGSSDITLSNNTIGSMTADGNISITHNNVSAAGGILAIWDGSSANTTISSNNIGGITIDAGTSNATLNSMIHLYTGSASSTIVSGNTIGGTSGVGGSIIINEDMIFRGIFSERTSSTTISSNTIQNVALNGNSEFSGIFTNVGALSCTSNTIKDITFGASNTKVHYIIAHGGNNATNQYDPAIGTLTSSPTITSNTISNITSNNTSTSSQVNAIYTRSSGTINVSNNTIGSASANNISIANTNDNYMIYFAGNGSITCDNNTIQQINAPTSAATTSINGIVNTDGTLSSCTGNTIKNLSSVGNKVHYLIYHNNTDNASITNNTIQDITLSGTGASELRSIYSLTSGTNTITGNTIGSTTANNISLAGAAYQYGILTDGNGTITCNTNTIQGYNLTETSASTLFRGIYNNDGALTCNSNTIKDISSAGGAATHYMIQHAGTADNASIDGNSISNITLSSANSGLYAIQVNSTGTVSISNNTIGSTTDNNISVAGDIGSVGIRVLTSTPSSLNITGNTIQEFSLSNTGTSVSFNGIYASVGALNATNNTIKNIDAAGTPNGTLMRGIYFSSGTAGATISSNNIEALNATTTGASNPVLYGISVTSVLSGGNMKKNMIRDFTNTATGSPSVGGVYVLGGWDVHNNVVLLSNGANTNNLTIRGIRDLSLGSMNIYHNTIKISGSASSGSLASYAYHREGVAPIVINVENNLFQNLRTGGTGDHNAYYASDVTNLNTDYNYLEVAADANKVGNWNGTNYSFANWQSNVPGEDNSLTGTTSLNTIGQAPTDFVGGDQGFDLFTGSTVLDDKLDAARDAAPWMGAYEGGVILPIELLLFDGVNKGHYNDIFWSTASELNNDYFTVERSDDGKHFSTINTVKGAGNSSIKLNYSVRDNNFPQGINYYRLVQTDYDGNISVSEIISINNDNPNRVVVKIINAAGQEVDEDYEGLVILIFNDGTITRTVQFKQN